METAHRNTVLIVEDEPLTVMALGDALEKDGFEVLRAEDGEKGLQLALDKHPDVLLVDLKMPHMGGVEMVRKLRKDAWGATARVIILTNASDLDSVQATMQEQAFQYFVKGDTNMSTIISAVHAQLKK